ncbi:MAG: translocation/assembly module TamB domain-containing protein [Deltaproteobacteria bacterium]
MAAFAAQDHHHHEVHGWRRVLRWAGRISLGLVALVALAIVGVVVFLHTDYGRNEIRGIANQQLANIFTGGGSVGRVEGTPFGDLVFKDVVINGPDGKPAITVKTLHVSASIFDLVHKDVKLTEVIAEDVDVAVKRDADGTFALTKLLKPAKKQPVKDKIKNPQQSPWNIDLQNIDVVRGHVMIDTGSPDFGVVNLDNVVIEANAQLHGSGTRTAGLQLGATWREREAPVAILGAVRDDPEHTIAPHLAIKVGGVTLAAANLTLVKALPGKLPGFAGTVALGAPRAAVAALVPRLEPPGDVALSISAKTATSSAIPIEVAGSVGEASIKSNASIDLEHTRVTGTLSTNEVDAATLTRGKVTASGAIAATFDVARGAPGELPTATATITGHVAYQQIPRAQVVASLETSGQHASIKLGVTGPAKLSLEAAITRAGSAIHLDTAKLGATIADAARASGGKLPVHGTLDIQLAASGELLPRADLAVKGRIGGKQLRVQELSASSLALAIDATHLPRAPRGSATVKLTDVMKGEMQLGQLDLVAKNRADGKIAVELQSRPKQDPWRLELAALVTPPGRGDTVTVDLLHHRVRAGNGVDWTGDTGRVVIDPRHVALSSFATASRDGRIALAGTLERGGEGNLTAKVDIEKLALEALSPRYRGTLDVHANVSRTANRFSGTAELTGTALRADPTKPPIDVTAKLRVAPGSVVIDGQAAGTGVGKATIALDLVAPRDLTDAAAWKREGRAAIRSATIAVHGVDLAQISSLTARTVDRTVMPPPGLPIIGHVLGLTHPGVATPVTVTSTPIGGTLDGTFTLTPTTAKGDFKIANLQAPQVRGLGRVDAELAIDQPASDRIAPVLTIKSQAIGTVVARADLALPSDLTDPVAWQKLGVRLVHGASIRTQTIAIDPAMLERFGIHARMSGTANVTVDVGEALRTVKVVANVTDLHGSPIVQPITAHFEANLDGTSATARFDIKTQKGAVSLITVAGKLPLTIAQLRDDPAAIGTAPLTATITLDQTSAPALLAVFGRDEITAGTMSGKIDVTGTIAKPVVAAHLLASDLKSRPGLHGRPTPTVRRLSLDASYGDHGGKVTLVGEEDSGGALNLVATLSPHSLASSAAQLTATRFDLAPIFAFAPDPLSAASGTLDARLDVKGFDVRTAQVAGELHLHQARVPIAPTVGTLRRANIDVTITNKDIKVAGTGRLGKGDVSVEGSIALNGVDLDGGTFKAVLKHVSPIGALEPSIDSVITGKMSRQGAKWIADVTVDKTFVKITKLSGEALKPVGTPSDLVIGGSTGPHAAAPVDARTTGRAGVGPQAPPAPESPGLIAHIKLNPIKVESDEFRTTLRGKLDITTDAHTVGVVGTVEAVSGDLDLFGRRYRIERAAVTFDGTVDPIVSVRFTHDFPDVETITEVRGRLSHPDLQLSSDNGSYSQEQLLGFLLGGEPNGDPSSGSARDKAASLGSSIVANQIGGYIKKALPFDLDVLKYEAGSATSSAAITVGSWLTHTLFFSFTQHLSPRPDENSSEGTLEYWFTRRLELETTAGDRNFDGVDLLWRKRY